MHRKYLALAGVLCMAAVTAGGCKNSEEDTVKNIKIGVTLYDQYDTFLSEMMTEFTEYAADKEEDTGVAINVEILDASQSQLTQNEQVKSLIDKGCDVVCVNLVDRTEPTTITDFAENHDVPIIFFNRELVKGMVNEHEITKKAYEQANEIIESAQKNAREIRLGARQYADNVLGSVEDKLSGHIAEIQAGRAELKK